MPARLDISIDPVIKKKVNKLYSKMGLSLSSAVKLFFTQSLNDNGLPFRPTVEPKESIEARKELSHPERLKTFHSVDSLWRDLND